MSQQLKRTAASFEAPLWKREPWTRLRKPPERWWRGWDSRLLLPRRPARCVPSVRGTGLALPAGARLPNQRGPLMPVPMASFHFVRNNLKATSARPGLQTPCLFGEHPKATGAGAILSQPVLVTGTSRKSRDFPGPPSSLIPELLFAYIPQKPFLWGCVVGLDFTPATLKQPACYALEKSQP